MRHGGKKEYKGLLGKATRMVAAKEGFSECGSVKSAASLSFPTCLAIGSVVRNVGMLGTIGDTIKSRSGGNSKGEPSLRRRKRGSHSDG